MCSQSLARLSVHTHFWRRGRVISGPGEGRERGACASLAWLVGRGQARLQDAESSSSVHWLSCECPSPQRGLSSHSPQHPEQWPVGSRCSISLGLQSLTLESESGGGGEALPTDWLCDHGSAPAHL